jgi:hypothetical protein
MQKEQLWENIKEWGRLGLNVHFLLSFIIPRIESTAVHSRLDLMCVLTP